MKRLLACSFLALPLLLPLAGCDSDPVDPGTDAGPGIDGGGVDAGGDPLALDDFTAAYASAICDYYLRCTPEIAAYYGDQCEELVGASLEDTTATRWRAAIGRGTAAFHPPAAAACIRSVEVSTCVGLNDLSACLDVVSGTTPIGGECYLSEECEDGYCGSDEATCPATCAAFVEEGESCSGSLSCRPPSLCRDGTCQTGAEEGEPCADRTSCAAGLACADPDGSGSTRCVTLVSLRSQVVGETCDGDMLLCAPGLACAYVRDDAGPVFECVERLASGAACTFSVGYPSSCPDGEYCPLPTGSFEGASCAPQPAIGEPCGPTGQCAPGAYCDTFGGAGTCLAIARVGESCANPTGCTTFSCDPETSTCTLTGCYE